MRRGACWSLQRAGGERGARLACLAVPRKPVARPPGWVGAGGSRPGHGRCAFGRGLARRAWTALSAACAEAATCTRPPKESPHPPAPANSPLAFPPVAHHPFPSPVSPPPAAEVWRALPTSPAADPPTCLFTPSTKLVTRPVSLPPPPGAPPPCPTPPCPSPYSAAAPHPRAPFASRHHPSTNRPGKYTSRYEACWRGGNGHQPQDDAHGRRHHDGSGQVARGTPRQRAPAGPHWNCRPGQRRVRGRRPRTPAVGGGVAAPEPEPPPPPPRRPLAGHHPRGSPHGGGGAAPPW